MNDQVNRETINIGPDGEFVTINELAKILEKNMLEPGWAWNFNSNASTFYSKIKS